MACLRVRGGDIDEMLLMPCTLSRTSGPYPSCLVGAVVVVVVVVVVVAGQEEECGMSGFIFMDDGGDRKAPGRSLTRPSPANEYHPLGEHVNAGARPPSACWLR